MSRGRKIVGIWPNLDAEAAPALRPGGPAAAMGATSAELAADPAPAANPDYGRLPEPATGGATGDHADPALDLILPAIDGPPPARWPMAAVLMVAAVWMGGVAWTATRGFAAIPAGAELALWLIAGAVAVPAAALFWVGRLLAGRDVPRRFANAATRMQAETERMRQSAAALAEQLTLAQQALAGQSQAVQTAALSTVADLVTHSSSMAARLTEIQAARDALLATGNEAQERLDGLAAALPRVDAVAQRMVANLRDAGRTAHQHGAAIEAGLAAMAEQVQATDTAASDVAARLAARVAGLQAGAAVVAGEVEAATARALANTTSQLADIDAAQSGVEAGLAAVLATLQNAVEAAGSDLTGTSEAALAALRTELARAEAASRVIGAEIAQHQDGAEQLTAALAAGADQAEAQMARLADAASSDRARIVGDYAAIGVQLGELDARIAAGRTTGAALTEQAEALLTSLTALAAAVEDGLPAAVSRLTEQGSVARASIAGISEPLTEQAAQSAEIAARLGTARAELDQFAGALVALEQAQVDGVARIASQCADAEVRVAGVAGQMAALGSESDSAFRAALALVEESASTAAAALEEKLAQQAEAVSRTIAASAQAAIDAALDANVRDQLAVIEAAASGAVAAADAATDRLMRQLITIMDTSAAIEARVADADAALGLAERDTLARKMALLTDALKSTSIDLVKCLSSEVSEPAWEAYLKGDRGVFLRRAVKLTENSEARQIARMYQTDPVFQGHVNQYIHDFEAMLRNLMGTRDGSAISVTLLSSDIGKLYVILAQAIDRLRN